MALELHMKYFAALREQAGRSQEKIATEAKTPAQLYEELTQKHGLKVPKDSVRVAVDGEFESMDTTLKGGETIVFIPPVAGG